jgi:hypothetical protein
VTEWFEEIKHMQEHAAATRGKIKIDHIAAF